MSQIQNLALSPRFVCDDSYLHIFVSREPVFRWLCPSPQRRHLGGWAETVDVRGSLRMIDIGEEGGPTSFRIGLPFHGMHTKGHWIPDSSESHCKESYLAIGVADVNGGSSAFVVRAPKYCPTEQCEHTVLDFFEGHSQSTWKAAALLALWRQGESSLGTVMAISPQGCRIAAGDWSRLLIWAFDPSMLHYDELEFYFPERDYNVHKGIGRIRPTKLWCPGVIYSLTWLDEHTLYAATDQGIVRWNMDHTSHGRREMLPLKPDFCNV